MRRAAILCGLALAACEAPLAPIAPSDRAFSMSGYLDASADTQWVRVEPLARTTDPAPAPIEAVVTLVGPGGAEARLTQVVRTFETGPAHLFWTTAEVAPGADYRLVARRPDGAETTVRIEVPSEASFTVDVDTGPFACPTIVTVRGAERVADVQARYLVEDAAGQLVEYRFPHTDTFVRLPDGAVQAAVYFGDDARLMGLDPVGPVGLVRSDVVVAVATDLWPDAFALTLEQALGYESPAVAHGVGFVGGVVTRRSPFTPGVKTQGFGNNFPCTS